jgi:gliding motility-associated-like protein
MQCSDWVMSYQLCCRNAAITNIANPSNNTFYIYATLNNQNGLCNNSPTFSNKPVPFACLGQEFCFNHGATDVDGDSLVYSLITPYQNANSTVQYNAPYSATSPLASSPAVNFNNSTGDICMTPTALQVTVMAVLVREYRNGVLIGSVERDIQVTVLNCGNNLPSLSGINGTNNFSASVCAGQQLCFNINSFDPDAGQNVSVNWDGSIPNATFTTSAGSRPTGTFCWTPTAADISNNPYCFTVTVRDDACPMNGQQVYSYCITVNGVVVNAGPDQTVNCGGQTTLTANASMGSGNYTYQWSNGANTQSINVGPGTYIVTVNDGTCTGTDTVVVNNNNTVSAAFTAPNGCAGTALQFTNQSTTSVGTITTWSWNFAGLGSSNQQNPSFNFPSAGTYTVTLIATASNGCVDTATAQVTINTPPVAQFTAPSACAGSTITMNNTSTPVAGSTWSWSFGNGTTSTQQNPSVTYSNAGAYNISLLVTASNGCTAIRTVPVNINPLPVPSFTSSALACQGSAITFNNTSTAGVGSITSYSWNFGNGQTSTAANPIITFPNAGNYPVSLTITNSAGCTATITQNLAVNPTPVASAGTPQAVCLGASATLFASGGNTYAWSNGQTTSSITVTPTTTTTYTVTVTDITGCTASSNAVVTVRPLPVIVVTPDRSICLGQSATITASGASTYLWSPLGSTASTVTVSPTSSTSYAVTGTDAFGCSSTSFSTITVNQLPQVNLASTFVCPGGSAILNAGNPGSTYQWSNGQNSQSITVNAAGTYTVTVTNTQGCSTIATAVVSQGGSFSNSLQNASFCAGGSTTLNAGNPGSSYLWNTGATTQSITVNSGGNYSVIITDANGCSGILNTTVNVNPLPQANFTPNDICILEPLQFIDISTITSGSIVGWSWNFGDGNISQQQNPVHTYNTHGSYTVILTVTSAVGCTDTAMRTFNVYPLPQANFSYNFGCVNEPIQFNDQSFTQMGNIIGWDWDFGDGTTSTQQNPTHAFSTPGMHVVTLTITTVGGCTDVRPRNIHIYPIPDLAFTTQSSGVCLGTMATITNTSSTFNGAINSWFWDFGDGTTDNSANPSHLYTNPGTYNITLIGTTSHGCIDTISQPFTVFPLPVANAGPNATICVGQTANLTASGGVSYQWSNGSTSQNIQVTPTSTQNYYVTVTDINGCTDTDSVMVFVNPLPIAIAGADTSVCLGKSITLIGNAAPSVNWNPGNANTTSITVSPLVTTTYVYTVTSVQGCINRDTIVVTVNPLPLASAGSDTSVCSGGTATLTATGGVSYSWSPGGQNTATIFVTPTTQTTYGVTVTDANGCSSSDAMTVFVNPVPVVNFSPQLLCVGNTTVLDAGNPGSTYLWFPGGETTQAIVVSDSGNYDVEVINSFGCLTTGTAVVTLGGTNLTTNPTNVNLCDGQTTVLDAGNPGAVYQWSNGSTAQTISVSNSGSYTVTVSDPAGCSSSFVSNVFVNPLPQLSFTANSACLGTQTSVSNNSTISNGSIMTWNWNFGDASFSALQNPNHIYAAAGNYNITLTAQSAMGCVSSVSQPVSVYQLPNAMFNASAVCEGIAVNFADGSSSVDGALNAWDWNFGDGQSSQSQNPQHLYASAGFWPVTLAVSTIHGCAANYSSGVVVHPKPEIVFSMNDVCEGNQVQFNNNSTISTGTINTWSWNFGDGSLSSLQAPVYTYGTPLTYNVSLSAVSNQGCSESLSLPITIYPNPRAMGSVVPVCSGEGTQFSNQSTISLGTIVSNYWNFGDNASSNAVSPTHAYAAPGTYNTLLVVTSDFGCVDSFQIPTVVNVLPNADFNNNGTCFGNQTQLTDLSVIPSGTISNWEWTFGDGSVSNQQNPTHNYLAPGSYVVGLRVTSDNGCVDSTSRTINVFPIPVSEFAGSDVCFGSTNLFYDQSTILGGGSLANSWDFGDNTTATGSNVSHQYASPGVYQVTLVSTSPQGCVGQATKSFEVYELPVASFGSNNACEGKLVNFIDQSTSNDGTIGYWNWQLGDGQTSLMASPAHIYASAGTYNVTLQITSSLGCSNTITSPVTIYSLPVPVITTSDVCEYEEAQFGYVQAPGDSAIYQFAWSFGDGTTSNSQNPSHQFATWGTYDISLAMTNGNGCVDSTSMALLIHPAPEMSFTSNNGCAGTMIGFQNNSTVANGTISSHSWTFGDGSPFTYTMNPSHAYTNPGTFDVTLVGVSNHGCRDTVTQPLTVYPNPVPDFIYDNPAGCGPLRVDFTDASTISSGAITQWQWNFGYGMQSAMQNPTNIFTQPGTYNVTLAITSDMGCTASITQNSIITVYPNPIADFNATPTNTTIFNPTITLDNLSQGGSYYNWTFGDGGISPLFEPTHTYADTGSYSIVLVVANNFGCRDTAVQVIRIEPEVTVFIPTGFTPNGDGTNDYFNISGLGIVNVVLDIYNRWGERIFTTNDMEKGWDGTYMKDGNRAQEDVYVYDAYITDVFGKRFHKYGHVALVR